MNLNITDNLELYEKSIIIDYLEDQDYYCIEQHPDWNYQYSKSKIKFFYLLNDQNNIICYGKTIISKKGIYKTARIDFGPVFKHEHDLIQCMEYLYKYFKENHYSLLSVQLAQPVSEKTELIEYILNQKYKIKYYFKPGNLWSSLIVDLTKSENDIFRTFSKGHKSDIKRGEKLGLEISLIESEDDLKSFIDLYMKMSSFRKIVNQKEVIQRETYSIYDFINQYKKGFIMVSKYNNIIVGGVIIIYQGLTARFYKGASDPEYKEIPASHLLHYEAMKMCKKAGIKMYDLWGYNHFVREEHQFYLVNRFKRGFTKQFIFFNKRMNIIIRPIFYCIFEVVHNVKKYIKVVY